MFYQSFSVVYSVKEIFFSLQGEGLQTGKVSLFCRFSGCNLWNGLEKDRKNAICRFCDTDFVGIDGKNGGKYETPALLAEKMERLWQENAGESLEKHVIFTGGEPLLQLDESLLKEIKKAGFRISVETNGSIEPPKKILALLDWICVSPKEKKLQLKQGDELKFVYPQKDLKPEDFLSLDFKHFFLQPMANENQKENTRQAMHYCLTHPKWRLSLQLHKILDIP